MTTKSNKQKLLMVRLESALNQREQCFHKIDCLNAEIRDISAQLNALREERPADDGERA